MHSPALVCGTSVQRLGLVVLTTQPHWFRTDKGRKWMSEEQQSVGEANSQQWPNHDKPITPNGMSNPLKPSWMIPNWEMKWRSIRGDGSGALWRVTWGGGHGGRSLPSVSSYDCIFFLIQNPTWQPTILGFHFLCWFKSLGGQPPYRKYISLCQLNMYSVVSGCLRLFGCTKAPQTMGLSS